MVNGFIEATAWAASVVTSNYSTFELPDNLAQF